MTKEQAIKKYNLDKTTIDCFGGKIKYDCYTKEYFDGNIKTIYTLENEMSNDIDNGKIYFLTIEKFDYSHLIYNKKLNIMRPKMTTKCVEILDN